MTRPPLMTTPDRVDGRRLRSLFFNELLQLLEMRIKSLHARVDSRVTCISFDCICEVIEVLNALQNFPHVSRDGDVWTDRILTLFMPPLYEDYRERAFGYDGDGI